MHMQGSVYERLFAVMVALIPDIERPEDGASYYAPPRIEGDCASYCALSNVTPTSVDVEISQDVLIDGAIIASPWMAIRVDRKTRSAELTAIEMTVKGRNEFQRVQAEDGTANTRRSQLQAAAVNNLASMLMLGGAFQPVGRMACKPAAAEA